MDKKEAISFLKMHQPMPDDKEIAEDTIKKYNDIREYFLLNPDEECIPLFLNSFGERDGLGVYQLVDEVIIQFDKSIVLPHLLNSLDGKSRSVRYWSAQIAASFPAEELFKPLEKLILDDDYDVRISAIVAISELALCGIKVSEVTDVLENAFSKEKESDISDFIQELLKDIKLAKK